MYHGSARCCSSCVVPAAVDLCGTLVSPPSRIEACYGGQLVIAAQQRFSSWIIRRPTELHGLEPLRPPECLHLVLFRH